MKKNLTVITHTPLTLLALSLLLTGCIPGREKEDLDPSQPLGAFSYLYSLLIPGFLPSTEKEFKTFFNEATASSGIITGTKISVNVPFGTDVKTIRPSFFHTGVRVTVGQTENISGQTVNDFTNPVTYRVTAKDTSIKDYAVTVSSGTEATNSMLDFQEDSLKTRAMIVGSSILLYVPYGTDLTSFKPTFSHNGVRVNVSSVEQISGKMTQNFSNPVVYEVVSSTGTKNTYTAIALVGNSSENTIKYFKAGNINAKVSGNSIVLQFPIGTDISAIAPVVYTMGKTVKINGQTFVNGETLIDFTKTVKVQVTSADGNTREYSVYTGFTEGVPGSFSYSGTPFTFTRNTAMSAVVPNYVGEITSCSVTPSLPAGLSLDPKNCGITGTPTAFQIAVNYTVIASNSYGSSQTGISITVGFMTDWSVVQPILQAQEVLGVSGTETATTFGALGAGGFKWRGGVLAPNGKIYAIPDGSASILVINPANDTSYTFGSVTGAWVGGVLAPNGKIYGIPFTATSVLVIDPETDTVSTFGSFSGGPKWIGGVTAPNGKIYSAPYSTSSILAIDPSKNTASTISASSGYELGVLAPNGKIYFVPGNPGNIQVLDPATDTVTTFSSVGSASGGALVSNGKIYGVPYSQTNVLIIDSNINTTSVFGSLIGSSLYMGAVTAPNGKVYGIPSCSATVLAINTSSNTTAAIGALGGACDKWAGGVLAPNGKIYGIPRNSATVLVIDTKSNGSWPADLYLSPYFNKY